MADTIDNSGARLDLVQRQGDTFKYTSTITVNGSSVTPDAARIAFKSGTLTIPGNAVSGVTGTATIAANVVTWGILTAAYTRLFLITAGEPGEYIYSLEVDLPSPYSTTQTIHYGVYQPAPEIA